MTEIDAFIRENDVRRLPPGPEPAIPFVDQIRGERRDACQCGAMQKFGHGDGSRTVGRCGCRVGKPASQCTVMLLNCTVPKQLR